MLLREYLQAKGYVTDLFSDGEAGYKGFTKGKYDLCVLDVMMPKKDGFTLAQEIRSINPDIPVIFLTAKTMKEDILEGFKIGADDYLTKPFSINELLARVHSLIRRYTQLNPVYDCDKDILQFKNMTIDNINRIVLVHDVQIDLTVKEFNLLFFLASHKGIIFTKKQIYMQVWEEEYAFDDSNIMSFISKLRKKIEPDPEHPIYILTVRGIGYRFNGEV